MAQATKVLSTGIRILSGTNVPVYTLEYLTSTGGHKQGDFERIVVPYIELGRDPNCVVSFSDEASTVSRRHAAISRNGKEVVIRNLSGTNPTLVNGRPVKNEYFLNSGDEIQLSLEGPRLRYNTSASGTAKMGFTNKMNLVMAQAIKPYKVAASIFLVLFLASFTAAGYFITTLTQKGEQLEKQLAFTQSELKQKEQEWIIRDSLLRAENKRKMDAIVGSNQRTIGDLTASLTRLQGQLDSARVNMVSTPPAADMQAFYQTFLDDVFFITVERFEAVNPDGSVEEVDVRWTCTGFVLDDGRFVTARHCVQSWRFINASDLQEQSDSFVLNVVEQRGWKLNVTFKAQSKSRSFYFTINDFTYNDRQDENITLPFSDGSTVSIRVAEIDNNDWAYAYTDLSSSSRADSPLSYSLTAGTDVIVLGFSYGLGAEDSGDVSPLFSRSTVARDGLTPQGSICLTNRNFGQGNSGGPVYVQVGDEYRVIGIVSAGLQSEIGFIVPIGDTQN